MSYGLSEGNPVRVAPSMTEDRGGLDPIMGDILAAVGGKAAKDEYLQSLRCPNGRGITWVRHGSNMGRHMKPVDKYSIECKCGKHRATIHIDAYSCGPREPIGLQGWTLGTGPDAAPAATASKKWWQF